MALVVSSMVAGAAAAAELERFEYTKQAMGVEARVVLYAADEATAADAAAAAFERIDELDRVLSHWREDSALAALVRAAGTGPVEVPHDLYRVLELVQAVAPTTRGTFDVTLAPLARLWRACADEGRLPTEAELTAARATVGLDRVRLERPLPAVTLAAGTELDLGGVGKGYACDRALDVLAERGVTVALVEVGGDLAVGSAPPGRPGWEVLVGGNSDAPPQRLVLSRAGVASSGDRHGHVEVDGVRYSHVIDPRTGLGTTHGVGFGVVAESAAVADVYATAACVLGPYEGRRFLYDVDAADVVTDDAGLTRLFDGTSLARWTPTGGRYDGAARWTVEDGSLVGRTGADDAGGLLYTQVPWTHYAVELDVKIDAPFDSGLFVRMRPPAEGDLKGAQITLDDVPGGEIAAVYSDGFLRNNTAARRFWLQQRWNHVEVRCTGFDLRLQVFLNGHLVTDYRLPDDAPGYATDGLFGLQVHPGPVSARGAVRFRNVGARALPAFGAEPLGRRDGWAPLIDGPDLAAWEAVGAQDGYAVVDGELHVPARGTGELRTREDYRDFRLRLDFALARMANSGVYLRSARTTENASYSGAEMQLIDDFNWELVTGTALEPYQLTGGLYGSLGPGASVLRPIGEWNTLEILYRGPRLAVALNSTTLYDVDTHTLTEGDPFAERVPEGFLGFQRYGAPEVEEDVAVRFRDVRVQRLRR